MNNQSIINALADWMSEQDRQAKKLQAIMQKLGSKPKKPSPVSKRREDIKLMVKRGVERRTRNAKR